MNRERAETHLRLLAEAELRAAVGAGSVTADRGDASYGRMVRVARALADVHALDYETADAILSDHSTALGARQRSDQARRMMRFRSALGQRAWLARRAGGSQIVADPPNLPDRGAVAHRRAGLPAAATAAAHRHRRRAR